MIEILGLIFIIVCGALVMTHRVISHRRHMDCLWERKGELHEELLWFQAEITKPNLSSFEERFINASLDTIERKLKVINEELGVWS